MGVSVGQNTGRRGRARSRPGMMSEINVTPLVDVMLVLLIVFMVTAPLLTVGVPVDLPEADAPSLTQPEEPLVVSVDGEGRIFIQETETTIAELAPRLAAITGNNPETRIYLRGDRTLNYGRVMEVMGTVNAAGFNRVALVAEVPRPK
ncbi:MAG: protein TolR [Alphaproteobacteria bacterium]